MTIVIELHQHAATQPTGQFTVISFLLVVRGRKLCGEWISCPFNTSLYSYHPTRARKKTVHSFDPHCQVPPLPVYVYLPHTLSVSPPFRPSLFALLDAPMPPAEDRFIMPDEFAIPEAEGPGRAKRSPINSNRVGGLNVETLVVADRKMLEKHGRDNVTTYVLTVMNMVRVGKSSLCHLLIVACWQTVQQKLHRLALNLVFKILLTLSSV